VRALQPLMPDLIRQEQEVRSLLGIVADSQMFVVQGRDPEAVLEAEEQLRARLDGVIAQGGLDAYSAVSQALPSAARQAADRGLLAAQVYNADGLLARFMRELGYDEAVIAQRRAAFSADAPPLAPVQWLASAAADPYRHLWLGDIGGGYASVLTLAGARDLSALSGAARGSPA